MTLLRFSSGIVVSSLIPGFIFYLDLVLLQQSPMWKTPLEAFLGVLVAVFLTPLFGFPSIMFGAILSLIPASVVASLMLIAGRLWIPARHWLAWALIGACAGFCMYGLLRLEIPWMSDTGYSWNPVAHLRTAILGAVCGGISMIVCRYFGGPDSFPTTLSGVSDRTGWAIALAVTIAFVAIISAVAQFHRFDVVPDEPRPGMVPEIVMLNETTNNPDNIYETTGRLVGLKTYEPSPTVKSFNLRKYRFTFSPEELSSVDGNPSVIPAYIGRNSKTLISVDVEADNFDPQLQVKKFGFDRPFNRARDEKNNEERCGLAIHRFPKPALLGETKLRSQAQIPPERPLLNAFPLKPSRETGLVSIQCSSKNPRCTVNLVYHGIPARFKIARDAICEAANQSLAIGRMLDKRLVMVRDRRPGMTLLDPSLAR